MAPINPTGPLPPGLRPELIKRAYAAKGKRHAPIALLKRLDRRAARGSIADGLKRALGTQSGRRAAEKTTPLHDALYRLLRNTHGSIYRAVIAPAEYTERDRIFIDPQTFCNALAAAQTLDQGTIEPGSDWEALAGFVLAFGLLQPSDAQSLVAAVVHLDEAFARYFGVTSASEPPTHPDLPSTLESSNSMHSRSTEKLRGVATEPHSELGQLEKQAIAFDNLREELSQAEKAQDWLAVSRLAGELGQLNKEMEKALRGLEERHSVLLPRQGKEHGAGTAHREWIGQVSTCVRQARESSAQRVRARADEVRNRCQRVQLPVPEALATVTTEAQVAGILDAIGTDLRVAEALASEHLPLGECMSHLTPAERVIAYSKILTGKFRFSAQDVVNEFVTEPEIFVGISGTPHTCLAEAISQAIESGATLPPRAWAALDSLVPGDTMDYLHERGLASQLRIEYDDDIPDMVHFVRGHYDRVPTDVARRLRVHASSELTPLERLSELGNLVSQQGDESVAVPLFDALTSLGRQSDAVFCAYLREALGWTSDWTLREVTVLWTCLVDGAADKRRRPALERVLADSAVEVLNEDHAIAALFVVAQLDDVDGYLSLCKGPASEHFHLARSSYPRLVSELAGRFDDAVAGRHGEGEPRRDAEDVLRDLTRDLQRTSCYSSWKQAARYQVHFRRRLEDLIDALRRGNQLGPMDPDALIDEVRRVYRLAEPEGRALSNMRSYLATNFDRLQQVATNVRQRRLRLEDLERIAEPRPEEQYPPHTLAALVASTVFIEEEVLPC